MNAERQIEQEGPTLYRELAAELEPYFLAKYKSLCLSGSVPEDTEPMVKAKIAFVYAAQSYTPMAPENRALFKKAAHLI